MMGYEPEFDPSSTVAKVAKRQDPLFMRVCGLLVWSEVQNVVQLLMP